ncbi:imidazolonepropionase [Rubrivivax gelatinosus]|uniref:imidazolonepropionase n=1 Tax=Rubrivivax gelatinosus TaxID=28068 RepID=UPI00190732D9|nr:imidazolonepropionase [Rubrivivax gelatinosus]MBK1614078.1 imidazolonepropionase [Rubrivivax gelatinosus]
MALTLWREARLVTLAGTEGWGLIEHGAIVADGEDIAWVGPEADLPAGLRPAAEHRLGGALLTPGLVDGHTHLVYGGERAREFELRLQGASYADIAHAGGGILSTVNATRAADEDQLFASALPRARALAADGATTIEVKSGYGQALEPEARCLRAARRLGPASGLTVKTSFLGLHALPPEYEGRADDYVAAAISWLAPLAAEGLVDAVDAFCEHIAFTPVQTGRFFAAARALGLPVKLHAEQLSDQGGAALAAHHGALSCDHLEWLSEGGVRAMAAAGTVAMLLPGAFYCLRETRVPPVVALRKAGVPIALATDHNPGTSPLLSPTLAMNQACTLLRLTPEEALRGFTVNGAKALGLADRGRLVPGQRADFAIWDVQHPAELAYWLGRPMCRGTVIAGRPQ